jgi:hypothetical protein
MFDFEGRTRQAIRDNYPLYDALGSIYEHLDNVYSPEKQLRRRQNISTKYTKITERILIIGLVIIVMFVAFLIFLLLPDMIDNLKYLPGG